MADIDLTPDTPSSDYEAMLPYWEMVDAILGGVDALRAGGAKYLPQFPSEPKDNYAYRLRNSRLTNIFSDIAWNLASKPFSRPLALADGTAPDAIADLAEDIDGRGNNLHVFAASVFERGIAHGLTWVLVDHTRVPPGATLADERRLGARPYWVHIPARSVLAVYTAMEGGREVIVHARIRETARVRDGWGEREVERVRVFDRAAVETPTGVIYAPPTWLLYEEREDRASRRETWVLIEEGTIALDVIPLVPFMTGRRDGGGFSFVPPLRDVAHLQIEHYQQETNLKLTKELTSFPMLAGNGISGEDANGAQVVVPIGPASVLFAPPDANGNHGEWKFLEPAGTSLKFLADELAATAREMRELGRQPLTAQSGNLTVVTTAFAASKGNSAVQAWALALKDALEHALILTARWMRLDATPIVNIHTDFAIDAEGDNGPDVLLKMRSSGDLSQEQLWAEMQRRGILSADFDGEAETARLLTETPPDDQPPDIAAALGGGLNGGVSLPN